MNRPSITGLKVALVIAPVPMTISAASVVRDSRCKSACMVDRLWCGEGGDAGKPALNPEAGLLARFERGAESQARPGRGRGDHVDRSRGEAGDDAIGGVAVRPPDGRAEAIGAVVRQPDGLVQIAIFLHRQQRAENLLLNRSEER